MRSSRGVRSWITGVLALAWLFSADGSPLAAQGQPGRGSEPREKADDKEKKDLPVPKEVLSSTSHEVRIGGKVVRYTATAGNYLIKEEDGTPKANLFFVSYIKDGQGKDGESDPGKRPVLFSFNGGPGSSSIWLHMGLFGPRRVPMTDDGFALPPPYRLVDNEYSLLDLADLVFIDPVTTGFSRSVPGVDDKQFHGLEPDVEVVGKLIRLWTTRNQRWASPKFLAGESYGTTRAAALVQHLQDEYGMYFNGVMLISSILNFQTARFAIGNDLPYVLFLPTYTATAWYHGKLAPELQRDLTATLAEVRKFASTDYTLALMKGKDLPAAERQAIAARLARYTGLSQEYVEQTNLRIYIDRFTKELRRAERRTTGRLDSRFTGIDRDAAGEEYEYDPSMEAIRGPYGGAFNDYVRRELGYETDLPYEILTDRVRPWDWGTQENQYVNVAERLRQAMTRNPALRVFVGNGYYDLATPFFATEYTFSHLGLDPSLEDNVTLRYYEAGHMMYVHKPSLEKLRADLAEFVAQALTPEVAEAR